MASPAAAAAAAAKESKTKLQHTGKIHLTEPKKNFFKFAKKAGSVVCQKGREGSKKGLVPRQKRKGRRDYCYAKKGGRERGK